MTIDRRAARLCGLLALWALASRPAEAQVAPGDFFAEPVLILAGGGHHAPVRSMVFARPDGSQLLTGGMDKVVHVWNLDADRSRPARTLRPPNWRGFRGQVNALALSPADAQGQGLLAVAGYGVLGDLGEILLFRYPDATGQGTGEIVGQLSATPDQPGRPGLPGHKSVVTSLAFTPDGRHLASASNDQTVRIWDVAARRSIATLAEAQGPVNTLAIFANGTRLVAGGRDGILRLYDIADRARPRLLASAAPSPSNPRDPLSAMIVKVAVARDTGPIVVGTEGGLLVRRDPATLAGVFLPFAPIPDVEPGPVESLAISPDGATLAVSVVTRNLANPADPPTVSCVIQLLSLPDGRPLSRVDERPNLVQATAFSPDGRRLVYSGGDSQSVYVKSMAPGSPAPEEIPGQGSSLWDVGFAADSKAVRFARVRPAAPGGAAEYLAFDLRRRFLFDPEPLDPPYRHAVAAEAGWTIRPVGVTQVDFLNEAGQRWQGTLDPTDDRRWFCYTVIPPNREAGHPDPVAAVGTGNGVVLWNLANGNRTRFFNGHAGPVYSLASSPDGRWLATGSSDQTLRLWSLAGCDRPAPFGARFEQRDGSWMVVEVTPGGFADGIKLRPGHVVESFFVGTEKQTPERMAAILPAIDDQPSTLMYSFYARIGADPEPLRAATSKRDSPALSIFPALGRDWVMWTPRGHYDTSIAGDRKYLGWLTNQGSVGQLLAGRFDTIDKFERRFRQPMGPALNALDMLLDSGDPIRAAVAAPPVAPGEAGPRNSGLVRNAAAIVTAAGIAAPAAVPGLPVVAQQPQVTVRYDIAAAPNTAEIAAARLLVDGEPVANLIPGPPVRAASGDVPISVGSTRNPTVVLETVDREDVIRRIPIAVENRRPAPPKRASRLEVVSIGSESFVDDRLPAIRHAQADARDLAGFLRERLIDPETGKRFAADRVSVRTFDERHEVAAGPLTETIDDLKKATVDGRLAAGDVVAVVIESHFFAHNSESLFATAEPGVGPVPAAISATALAERLGDLSRHGCRVVVLVNAVHEVAAPGWDNDIKEWVRQLQSRSNVAVFVASDHGPSKPLKGEVRNTGHRAFADAVINVLDTKNAGRLRNPGGPITLYEFQRTLIDGVHEMTRRKQHAQVFLPETLAIDVPFLDPTEPARPAAALLKR